VTSHDRRRLQLRDGEPFAAISHPRDIDKHIGITHRSCPAAAISDGGSSVIAAKR
jgi:hypothetical protein